MSSVAVNNNNNNATQQQQPQGTLNPDGTYTVKKEILMCTGHSRPVVDLAYSNIIDNTYWIISACKDGKPMLRNGQTGDWVGTFEGHKGAVWSARLDSTAQRAVTSSADFTAKVWNAITGDEIHTFKHKHIVKTSDFSRDDTQILTGGLEKSLKLWDLNKPDAEPLVMEGHEQAIRVATFTNDPNQILSSAQDATLRVWDKRTLSCVRILPNSAKETVTSIELSLFGNGKYITTTAGSTVTFWDANSLEIVREHKFASPVESASLSPDGDKFVTGGEDFWVRLFSFEEVPVELECQKGHHGPVHAIRWAPDGSSFASGSEDGTIRISLQH